MALAKFYRIVAFKSSENTVESTISINPNHTIFQGHFPENPIVPGASVLQILKDLVSEKFQKKLNVKTVKNVKFLKPIVPLETQEVKFNIDFQEVENEVNIKNVCTFADGTIAVKCYATFAKN